ncbi:MAG TPA: hypothetical protein VMV78_07575 [Thiobacillus sp.]|nr:hypothetical protein [Thiobacillus sp.]
MLRRARNDGHIELISASLTLARCPKTTIDPECILTQLRAEGYGIVGSYDDADVVMVNACGFIDAAVQEKRNLTVSAASSIRRSKARRPTNCPMPCRKN